MMMMGLAVMQMMMMGLAVMQMMMMGLAVRPYIYIYIYNILYIMYKYYEGWRLSQV